LSDGAVGQGDAETVPVNESRFSSWGSVLPRRNIIAVSQSDQRYPPAEPTSSPHTQFHAPNCRRAPNGRRPRL